MRPRRDRPDGRALSEMAVLLYRVDERLIHGQVVVGWGHALRFDTVLVVDDELAESAWEQDLYRLAAGERHVHFSSVAGCAASLAPLQTDDSRTIVLTRGLAAMRALGAQGLLKGAEVNLGGQHHADGRREVLSYLHLSTEDLDDVQILLAAGIDVSARDLPDSTRVPGAQLVGT
ncbi:MAG: PTS sugar transporter subunit IIB [Gemmatimonadota bacterium]